MQIIFDEKEYILPMVTGTNPKFVFDEIIHKEIPYEEIQVKNRSFELGGILAFLTQ